MYLAMPRDAANPDARPMDAMVKIGEDNIIIAPVQWRRTPLDRTTDRRNS